MRAKQRNAYGTCFDKLSTNGLVVNHSNAQLSAAASKGPPGAA